MTPFMDELPQAVDIIIDESLEEHLDLVSKDSRLKYVPGVSHVPAGQLHCDLKAPFVVCQYTRHDFVVV